MCEEHNGWKNRETWAAALHLSNDEYLYNFCRELCSEGKRWSCGDRIEAFVTEHTDMILHPDPDDYLIGAHLWRNLLADVGSLWRVEWADVAESFMPEPVDEPMSVEQYRREEYMSDRTKEEA